MGNAEKHTDTATVIDLQRALREPEYRAELRNELETDVSDLVMERAADLLSEATAALDQINAKISWEINPSNYDHQQVCEMNAGWCEIGMIAETTLEVIGGRSHG